MKGTGRWTVQEAAERSTAAPTMAAALDARYMSGRKAERVEAAKTLKGPSTIPKVPKAQLIEDMKAALYCSKICSYAQVKYTVLQRKAFVVAYTIIQRWKQRYAINKRWSGQGGAQSIHPQTCIFNVARFVRDTSVRVAFREKGDPI